MKSIMRTARITGALYLALVPLGIFGILYVPATLFIPGDVATTVKNIVSSQSLFRLSIVSALMIQLVTIFLVLFLYKLLKPVNKNMAILMVVFSLVSVPIAMLNELNNFAALMIASDPEFIKIFTVDEVHKLVPLFLDLHNYGINIAQIFWGLWLFPMGYLIYRSGYLPRILGVIMIIGCFGYLIDSFAFFLVPDMGITLASYTGYGEIFLPLWLLIKGVDVEQYEKNIHKSNG